MTTHNLKKYKEAKVLLPHLNDIIKILSLTEKALGYYSSYITVSRILHFIKEEKTVLELHRDKFERIQKAKGKQ